MIDTNEADKIIAKNIPQYPAAGIPLMEAYGRVLKEDIYADRDLPPFNRSLMDGVAINVRSWEMGTRRFPIEGTQAAGTAQLKLPHGDSCIEVMTGAVIPQGADCVVPVEHFHNDGGLAILDDSYPLEPGKNIRPQGADHQKGSCLLSKGCRLLAPQIAVCAAVGKKTVIVSYCPKVAIISTGDEVVEIDEHVEPFQIRQSNSYFMKAALDNTKLMRSERFHFPDNKDILHREIKTILSSFDVLVLTGGVSMGKFDHVPGVLKELGVEVLFHKVKQKPGKPFWFGRSKEGKPVFALPGNPVSTQVGIYRYVIPAIEQALGINSSPEYAVLSTEVPLDTDLTIFLMVRVQPKADGRLEVSPVSTGGSGDFATVARSDGFMEIPSGAKIIKPGFVGRLYRW